VNECVETLANLTAQESSRLAVLEHGALPLLIGLCEPATSELLLGNLLKTLHIVAQQGSIQDAPSLVKTIMSIMIASPTSKIQVGLQKLVCVLGQEPSSRLLLLEQDIVTLIVNQCLGSQCDQVVLYATKALGGLSFSEQASMTILNFGGLEKLLDLYQTNAEVEVVANVASVLATMVEFDHIRGSSSILAVIGPLVGLCHAKRKPEALPSTTIALQLLSKETAARQEFHKHGAIAHLVELCHPTQHKDVLVNILGVFSNVAMNDAGGSMQLFDCNLVSSLADVISVLFTFPVALAAAKLLNHLFQSSAKPAHVKDLASVFIAASTDSSFESEVLVQILICQVCVNLSWCLECCESLRKQSCLPFL
jgi:hypothetical protein